MWNICSVRWEAHVQGFWIMKFKTSITNIHNADHPEQTHKGVTSSNIQDVDDIWASCHIGNAVVAAKLSIIYGSVFYIIHDKVVYQIICKMSATWLDTWKEICMFFVCELNLQHFEEGQTFFDKMVTVDELWTTSDIQEWCHSNCSSTEFHMQSSAGKSHIDYFLGLQRSYSLVVQCFTKQENYIAK